MAVNNSEDLNYILCYTREKKDEMIYSAKLANSMHLAYSNDGKEFHELNHNCGVLFAKATENSDGSLNAKTLKKPYIFYLEDGNFGIIAIRVDGNGENDKESKGKAMLYTSADLLQYKEIGLIDLKQDVYLSDIRCQYNIAEKKYIVEWKDEEGRYFQGSTKHIEGLTIDSEYKEGEKFVIGYLKTDIEGAMPRNIISISKKAADRLINKLTVPVNVKIEVPEEVSIKEEAELLKIRAKVIYSDGTSVLRTVKWNTQNINWSKPGVYQIEGKVKQDHFEFPVAVNRADPCIEKWNNKYYFIATNDADGNNSLYIREADNIPDLLKAEEVLLIDTNVYDDVKGLLWAPEFHIIEDDLYIFHGATQSEFFYEESNVMKLKTGGNPMNASDWIRPKRVVKKDGSYLCEAGKTISLDMTNFEIEGEYYVIWSQRQFLPNDTGAWLYIAKVDKDEPWKLISEPVVIAKPEYSWENNHVFVDEGPFSLIRDKKIYVTFSSALIDATYNVGILVADIDADLLKADSWTKGNYPLLTSASVLGEYGPGHNSYVIDDEGLIWNAYHAKPGVDGPRSSGIRRVHFDIDGYPVLDLTEDKDINKDLSQISMTVILK